jgi:hypothetical protein
MLFYITVGAPQAVPRTDCVEANRTACTEIYCSSMTRGFRGRIHPRHVGSIHSSSQSDDKGSQFQRPQHSSQSSGQQQSSFRPPVQGAEATGASEEDMGISPGKSIAYSVVKTRVTLQERARLPFRSKKSMPKQKPGRTS